MKQSTKQLILCIILFFVGVLMIIHFTEIELSIDWRLFLKSVGLTLVLAFGIVCIVIIAKLIFPEEG